MKLSLCYNHVSVVVILWSSAMASDAAWKQHAHIEDPFMQSGALGSYITWLRREDASTKLFLRNNHAGGDNHSVSRPRGCETQMHCDDRDCRSECTTAPKYEHTWVDSFPTMKSRRATTSTSTASQTCPDTQSACRVINCDSHSRSSHATHATKPTALRDRNNLDCIMTSMSSHHQKKCMGIRGGGDEDSKQNSENHSEDSETGQHTERAGGSMMGRKSYWRETYQRELENFVEFGDAGESWFDVSMCVCVCFLMYYSYVIDVCVYVYDGLEELLERDVSARAGKFCGIW
jgi:hypothetical protein